LIREIKKFSDIPVCVITNGSLLFKPEVRRALRKADVVMPTLCAASQEVLTRINRPHPSLKVDKIIQGLVVFRGEFSGQIWLELMFVKGLNDSPRELKKIKRAIRRIRPDKIQLNTVVRPPSDRSALPVTAASLKRIKGFLGSNCEIVAAYGKNPKPTPVSGLKKNIIEIIRRRPETPTGIAQSLGANLTEVIKVLYALEQDRRVRVVRHRNRRYYEPA
jgi:wyosine [tRNA(Phe)-imidazoG37] synthetase (radical SAM superfamily)